MSATGWTGVLLCLLSYYWHFFILCVLFVPQYAHYKDEMYIAAQRAFGVSPERHYRLLHAAVEEKPKIIVLSVIVQEAEGLEAKDANGKFANDSWEMFISLLMPIYWMFYYFCRWKGSIFYDSRVHVMYYFFFFIF